jgi:uncharacterized protein (TIGR03067 family)
MPRRLLLFVMLACALLSFLSAACAAEGDAAALQGVWVSTAMESDGRPAPADVAAKMRFTFKGDLLLIAGNFDDGREEPCPFHLDPAQSPKHLDFTPPKETKPLLAIYDLTGDRLKICLRHASSPAGRPTTFKTEPDSKLVLVIFKRQKP